MSIFEFTDMIRDVVHLYKFGGRSSLHRLFADLATGGGSTADRIGDYIRLHDCLVPVPLTPLRAAERGFNQSALLAKRIAHTLSIPCLGSILQRRGSSPPQSGMLDLHRRVRNVNDRFFLRESAAIEGKTPLLVDDVLTTGATAAACASVLLEGGAKEVNLLTIARTVRRDR
jgi:ComF family protein